MQRPEFELRRMEDERQRRAHAHRAIRWTRRWRLLTRAAVILTLLSLALLCAHLLGLLPLSL